MFQRIFISCALIILGSLAFVVIGSAQAPQAHAGTNGQQVGWFCDHETSITVDGLNQEGNHASGTWYGTSPIVTWNWWWKGNVIVTVYPGGSQHTLYVPASQHDDITYGSGC